MVAKSIKRPQNKGPRSLAVESSSARQESPDHYKEKSDNASPDTLDDLFQAAIAAYAQQPEASTSSNAFADDEDLILLDGKDQNGDRHARARSPQSGSGNQNSRRAASASALAANVSDKGKGKAIDKHLDQLHSREALDALRPKGQRAAIKQRQEARAQTAGSSWYDMPAFPAADRDDKAGPSASSSRYASSARGPTAEEMRREVQAIRLRNALDPKRFYKGGNKDKGMPRFAQLGRIVSSPLEPRQSLTKAERGRSVVEEMVRDAEASAYAKRKFGEHQVKSAAGGRGHSKAKTRRPSDHKRQRR